MNKIKTMLLGFLSVAIFGCNPKCEVKGIYATELLLTVASEKGIDYCDILSLATVNDTSAIKQLSLMNFENAVGYDHGIVLVELVEMIGEKNYINAIKELNPDELNRVESYFDVGLEYGVKDKKTDLNQHSPLLFHFFSSLD